MRLISQTKILNVDSAPVTKTGRVDVNVLGIRDRATIGAFRHPQSMDGELGGFGERGIETCSCAVGGDGHFLGKFRNGFAWSMLTCQPYSAIPQP